MTTTPRKAPRKIGTIATTGILFVLAAITIIPFIWMLVSSFAPTARSSRSRAASSPRPAR